MAVLAVAAVVWAAREFARSVRVILRLRVGRRTVRSPESVSGDRRAM